MLQEDSLLKIMRTNCCMFDPVKPCTHCFQCIGLIDQKSPKELNAFEAAKLFECKGDLFIFVRWKFALKILFPKIIFFILAYHTIFMKNMKIFFCNG